MNKMPVPSKDVIAQQARDAAASGLALKDACPYPFTTEEGRHFSAVYLTSIKKEPKP